MVACFTQNKKLKARRSTLSRTCWQCFTRQTRRSPLIICLVLDVPRLHQWRLLVRGRVSWCRCRVVHVHIALTIHWCLLVVCLLVVWLLVVCLLVVFGILIYWRKSASLVRRRTVVCVCVGWWCLKGCRLSSLLLFVLLGVIVNCAAYCDEFEDHDCRRMTSNEKLSRRLNGSSSVGCYVRTLNADTKVAL